MVKFYKSTSIELADEMLRKVQQLEMERMENYEIPIETVSIETFVTIVKSFLPSFASFDGIYSI